MKSTNPGSGVTQSMDLQINDFEMHYELHGDPAGEPLLWIHGFGGSGADWKYIFPEVPVGLRLIAPDMRGHGSSTAAQADSFDTLKLQVVEQSENIAS